MRAAPADYCQVCYNVSRPTRGLHVCLCNPHAHTLGTGHSLLERLAAVRRRPEHVPQRLCAVLAPAPRAYARSATAFRAQGPGRPCFGAAWRVPSAKLRSIPRPSAARGGNPACALRPRRATGVGARGAALYGAHLLHDARQRCMHAGITAGLRPGASGLPQALQQPGALGLRKAGGA